MPRYYFESYVTPMDAFDCRNGRAFGMNDIYELRKYLMYHYKHSKAYYTDVRGRDSVYYHNPVKVYDNSRCSGTPLGTMYLYDDDYYIWVSRKSAVYHVRPDGTLANGKRKTR